MEIVVLEWKWRQFHMLILTLGIKIKFYEAKYMHAKNG